MTAVKIILDGRVHRIAPSLRLVREIELELGSLPALAQRLQTGRWVSGELVALVHMLLDAAGRMIDYAHLGDLMMRDGLSGHAARAGAVVKTILEGRGA